MAGLLDIIFTNTDTKNLTREEVLAHLHYLDEIITPAMPIPQQVKYYGYKIRLGRKLLELDIARVNTLIYKTGCYQTGYRQQHL
ncbi:hypothetical protein AAE02nite_25070 [Adhaeribacter aerolatus]|uniref:Uncharacterized protein n=1 Tax=Adhaeribacter aerolatus TaxID=670289 RepID=A0A512AYP4_9BACT|nr:hypothetical protein [Adhaeribacter aerolatus]GEO04843.1 hypothetical protein AAE02nite_25070 [Adhaeribacter aerolatus]